MAGRGAGIGGARPTLATSFLQSEQIQFFALLMAPVLLVGALVAANVSVRAALETRLVVDAAQINSDFREKRQVVRALPPGVTVVSAILVSDEDKRIARAVRPVAVLAYGVTRDVGSAAGNFRGAAGNFRGAAGNFRGAAGNFRGAAGNFRGAAGDALVRASRASDEAVVQLTRAPPVEWLWHDAPAARRAGMREPVVTAATQRADVVQSVLPDDGESVSTPHSGDVPRVVSLPPQLRAGHIWFSGGGEVHHGRARASIVQTVARAERMAIANRAFDPAMAVETENAGEHVKAARTGLKLFAVRNAVALGAAGFVVLAEGDFRDVSFERDQCVLPTRAGLARSARSARAATWKMSGDDPAYGLALARAARKQTKAFVVYYDRYFSISYPMGDVPPLYGVCTDVVVRAYRALGLDLQELVHQSRIGSGDRSIAHRRVRTLKRFFERYADVLPVTDDPKDYLPGDIVTYHRPRNTGTRTHIGIVSDVVGPSGRPLLVHNRGNGPELEDALFFDPITGHFRYRGPAADGAQSVAARHTRGGPGTATLRTR